MGVSHTSALRPVKVSRKRVLAPSVDEPVANTRTSGKWSAAILSNSEGLGNR